MQKLPSKDDSQETCPQPGLLVDFLQGKLQPPAVDDCAAHVEHCQQCHETLRGLDSGDTLSEKVSAALAADHAKEGLVSFQIDQLIEQLTSPKFRSNGPAAHSEIMADRAAEVLRCVEPDEQTLGVLGDYALLRLIGSGSTGVVFQAIDRALDRTVALKVLRPSLGGVARERFLAEARSAASIEHPNVVTIFQVGQVDRLAFIAMPWLPGQTLEAKLMSVDSLEESQIVDTVVMVVSGLAAAHQQQLVHRDIKPANLWICDADCQIKILDFGLARISDDNPGLTATGMLAGTPNFMSPEQARGQELDGRSDLFSVGCLMYQLLTGRLPFGAPTVLATLQAIQNQSPIPPRQIVPDISQHLSDLTMCLLEKQPANRPESARQLIQMLALAREQWPITVNHYASIAEEKSDRAVAPAKQKATSAAFGFGGWRWGVTAVLMAMAGWGAWLFAPQIIRVMTDQGAVVIESTVEDVEVQVFADGKLIRVIDTQTQQSFDLKSGSYTFSAHSSGDSQNTFSVSPNQMTMSRGDTQIVKVTTPEELISLKDDQTHGDTETDSAAASYAEAVFDGKTFSQWINIAEFDRSQTSSDASLTGAASTADSDLQKAELTRVFSILIRRGKVPRLKSCYSDLLQFEGEKSYCETLNSVGVKNVLELIKREIDQGNERSRKILALWIYRFNRFYKRNRDRLGVEKNLPLWQAVEDKSVEFFSLAHAGKDQPGNEPLAEAFLWLAGKSEKAEQVVALAEDLGYSKSLEQRLLNGDERLRLSELPYAKILLGESEAVYQKYEQDLSGNSKKEVFDDFICADSMLGKLSDKRGATLLKLLEAWMRRDSSRFGGRGKAIYELVRLKPYLSEKFIRSQLEPELKRLNLDGWVEELMPSEVRALAPATDSEPKGKTSNSFPAQAAPKAGEKIVFKGHTFEHWLQVAKVDRDVTTRTDALKAAAATADTDDEVAAMIEFTRKICRKHGGDVLHVSDKADRYYAALNTVLDSLKTDRVVEFIQLEIAEGTEPSRKFCGAWLIGMENHNDWRARREVRENTVLADTLANHLESPGNSGVCASLVSSYQEGITKLKESALPAALKKSAADPQQRLLLGRQIMDLLEDDPDVFELFHRDLVDVETNSIGRLKLFNVVFPFNSWRQNYALPEQRLRLVLNLIDGVLRQDDQRLEFEEETNSGSGGGIMVGGFLLQWGEAQRILLQAMIEIHVLHPQLGEKLKTETLLPKLRELKVSLESASNDPQRETDFGAVVRKLMPDLDYLINKTSGDTDAQVPEDGFLKPFVYPKSDLPGSSGGGVF